MHKHRFIILRRLALILGLLYGYRAITMFVTNLPKADPNYFCTAKVSHVSISNTIKMHFKIKIIKIFHYPVETCIPYIYRNLKVSLFTKC